MKALDKCFDTDLPVSYECEGLDMQDHRHRNTVLEPLQKYIRGLSSLEECPFATVVQ